MRPTLAIVAFVLALVLMLAPERGERAAATPQLFLDDAGPVIVYDHPVCSLIDENAEAAYISGQDGTASIVIGNKSYWTFGDTGFLPNPLGRAYISNNVASSTDTNASDCIELTHKTSGSVAESLLDPLPEEMSIWPDGLVQTGPTTVHFFVASVVPGPTPWYVRGIGLARFDTTTLDATRVIELLWDIDSGFGANEWITGVRSPVVGYGYAHLFLVTSANRLLLARVPIGSIENPSAYTYFNGIGWSVAPSSAAALWTQSDGFNGAYVRWSARLAKWIAIYNGDLGGHVRVRTADAITGPWSREYEWIDCVRFVSANLLPRCYTGAFHPQYDRDGGRTMIISFATLQPYQVVLHEVRLGVPVYQWRAGADVRLSPSSPGGAFASEGIALYASDVPVPGFTTIRRFVRSTGESLYTVYSPGADYSDAGIAFYAPAKANTGANLDFSPVYRWDKGSEHIYSSLPGWDQLGYTRGHVYFYGMCGDRDLDGANDCIELAAGTDPNNVDTDGDGFRDRAASAANPNTIVSTDNCPLVANPSQANSDGEPLAQGMSIADWTNPNADTLGDACDPDLDNDRLTNDQESALGTDPRSTDSDEDIWPDPVEVTAGTDPLDASSKPSGVDTDRDLVPDSVEVAMGMDPFEPDSDSDNVFDMVEMRWLTNPVWHDTDGDGCDDFHEIASVNIDRIVTAADLQFIAVRFSQTGIGMQQVDLNRDQLVGTVDLRIAAQAFGSC